MKKKPNRDFFADKRGGARKGAGRPALSFRPVVITARLRPETAQTLRLLGRAGKRKLGMARVIDAMVEHCAADHTFRLDKFNPYKEKANDNQNND